MPAPNPSQNAGQGLSWSTTQDTEATHVSAGYRNALTFVLVPRTRIELAAPDGATRQKLRSPGELFFEVPVRGKAVNFEPGVTLDCEFSWLVKRGTAPVQAFPVAGARMVVAQDGTFQVQVGGEPPVLDLIAHRIINDGLLGYSLTPNFPHAEPATFEPAIPFNNVCTLSVRKPPADSCLIGEQVVFSPNFSSVLNKAELELRVVELDEGSSEVAFGPERYAFSHRWAPSLFWMMRNTTEAEWAIGFTNDTCERFADVGDVEEGAYEFGWQLWGRSREGRPQTLLLEEKEFLKLPRPKLEELRVEYDKSWEGTWEVHGKIANVSPRAELQVEVALVEQSQPGPLALTPSPLVAPKAPMRQPTATVRAQLQSDGVFEAHLGERHLMPEWTSLSPMPPVAPKAFAILTLPAAARDGKPGPIAPYLDFDDATYSPYKDEALCWNADAPWVCSVEATSLVTREPRPKRRRTGVTPNPAPPVDKGNQQGPLTWDEVWLDIVAWEAIVPYMYRDKPGNVTVGAGNLLRRIEPQGAGDKLAAKSLPFQNMDAARAATPEEIADAFNRVMALPKNMKFTEYAMRPKIALADVFIKELAKGRYDTEFLPAIKKGFPDFDTWPLAARRGVVDVTYNAGISIPLNPKPKWQPFVAAVRARNWTKAASEVKTASASNGNEQRSQWREDLFRYAAKVDKKPGS